ncbi:hypothetical protein AB0H30_19495 [Streptomyces pseudogriseolus]|uniref:hypothetical protein n=1 Tax=Streptomyces pseudogriseolus TaxID=36817 RepID=UPI00347A9CBC
MTGYPRKHQEEHCAERRQHREHGRPAAVDVLLPGGHPRIVRLVPNGQLGPDVLLAPATARRQIRDDGPPVHRESTSQCPIMQDPSSDAA